MNLHMASLNLDFIHTDKTAIAVGENGHYTKLDACGAVLSHAHIALLPSLLCLAKSTPAPSHINEM